MKKVMVVDDERDVTDLFEWMLRDNFTVIKAYSGKEALEKLEADEPDLILLDILMPDIDGWSVLESIRQSEKKDIPVIILTAVKPDFNILKKGIENYLVKPVTRGELITAVNGIFKAGEELTKYEAVALAAGATRETLKEYRKKLRQLNINENLLSLLKQIFTQKAMENSQSHQNLMKSFERALELQREEVRALQLEIEKYLQKTSELDKMLDFHDSVNEKNENNS